ncbi:MAG: lipoyl synthase [Pseudomonadota bacterium]
MSQSPDSSRPAPVEPGVKLRGAEKVARIPVKVIPTTELPRKPDWIRVRISNPGEVQRIKGLLREQKLHTVCEEAACPNLPECFGGGTATFMIMGDICTRRCPFCDVAHGRPNALDADEPRHLAETVRNLKLKYVVVTSVDRDDLKDGGARHFVDCITETRALNPETKIEILVPDFRGRMDIALRLMTECPPDVFNHNIETVPRLYRAIRPGSDYRHSLTLLQRFKQERPDVATKCGLMAGIGETREEIFAVLDDLRAHGVDLVTIGQYLQPSRQHAPVDRFVTPDEFREYAEYGRRLGFRNIWSGPMVRSSYHADLQFAGVGVGEVSRLRATQA